MFFVIGYVIPTVTHMARNPAMAATIIFKVLA